MKWFKEVFLPSLANGMNDYQSRWITEKQVDVCRRYMKDNPWSASCLQIKIDGRWYIVRIMKKGYGRLTVSPYHPNGT